jgi:cysteine desulfurase
MSAVLLQNKPENSHARHHAYGMSGEHKIKEARHKIAAFVGAEADEIIFTSGATESNNLIIRGLVRHLQITGKTHIITCAVEHRSVLEPLRQLDGFKLSILPVKPCGMIEAEMIANAVTPQTGLISIQAVNNELGTIQPFDEIAALIKERNILFHSDAAQALGKIDFNVGQAGVDFASFSAHKIYGPQGIGALYVKKEKKHLIDPLHAGGGQEGGLRSGTLPVLLCVGFGAACEVAETDRQRVQDLRELFLEQLATLDPIIYGHRDPEWNAPGIVALRLPDIDNETLVMALPGLAFGVGSACNSGGNKASHVIQAITGSEQASKEVIRISFGRFSNKSDVVRAAAQIIEAATSIRQLQDAG